jgi:hypothetical protein
MEQSGRSLVTIRHAAGHMNLSTTQRYIDVDNAEEVAAAFACLDWAGSKGDASDQVAPTSGTNNRDTGRTIADLREPVAQEVKQGG